MYADHLEWIVAAAYSHTPVMDVDLVADSFPLTELQIAIASAVSNGESLAAVATAADLPSLVVLDAVELLQAGRT